MLTRLPRSTLSHSGFPAIPSIEASIQLALQYQLESTQWWPFERLRAQQLKEVQALLGHAAATVPFYAEQFARHGVRIPDHVDEAFFAQLPITPRSAVQQAGERMISTQCPPDHGTLRFGTTSGSTGRAVKFARNDLTHTYWLAFAMRDHLWHNRDFAGKLAAIRWFSRGTAEPPHGVRQPDWGTIVSPIFSSGPSVILNVAAALEQQMTWLKREGPDYLVSFPSNLLALSRYAEAERIRLPALREVRTIGETLNMETRAVIADAFQAEVTDIYTCEEAGYLALQCPQTGHYHVQSENVILEIVDQQGRACPPGTAGQVLITTLHNYATPLIRYELGDMAEFGEPCSCGRGLPVIRAIHGRKRNRLILPSGQSIFPYLGEHGQISQLTGIKLSGFQCIQHSLDDVELKLVMEKSLNEDQQVAVAALTQRNLGHPFPIRISQVDEIPRGPTGKFEDFVSKLA